MAAKEHSVPRKTLATHSKIWWSIMLWDYVASGGTGNLVKVEGRMNCTQYQQILENNVEESVTKLKLCWGWIFQQDNDPKHCYSGIYSDERSAMFWNGHPSPQTEYH